MPVNWEMVTGNWQLASGNHLPPHAKATAQARSQENQPKQTESWQRRPDSPKTGQEDKCNRSCTHTLGLGLEKLGGSWMVLTGLHSTKSVAPQVLTNVAIDSNMDCPISFRETFSRLFEPKNYLLFHFE